MSTITMWRLRLDKIEPVKCSRVTAGFVYPVERNGRREARESDWNSYYETWADAHAAMLHKAVERINAARLQLGRARSDYNRIKGMKPPADAEVSQ